MLAVSNTSPLSNLAIIDRLDLLREQLGAVTIPPAVRAELSRLPNPAALRHLDTAIKAGWVRVTPLSGPVPAELSSSLGLGEAEALTLALQVNATIVLLDESAARQIALQLGLAHTGILGVLREARTKGRIASLKAEIARLRSEARFFVAAALERALLISVHED